MEVTLTEHSTHIVFDRGELRFNFKPQSKRISLEEFEKICRDNRDMQIEMDKQGDVIIMPPVHSETSEKNSEIGFQLRLWAKKDKTGKVYESSGGFILPNGAIRSPDACWIKKSRLEKLSEKERRGFIHICPDFVIELRSASDSLPKLKAKMSEYIENGAQLGWLLDAGKKKVYVYRQNENVEVLENPKSLSGENILKNFTLDLSEIF